MAPETDAELLSRSVKDPSAFVRVYERHASQLLRFVRRRLGDEVAEDVAHEVFLRAFRHRAQYVASYPTALPWLYSLTGSVIADNGRAERRRRRLVAKLVHHHFERSASTDDDPTLSPELLEALEALRPADRETFLLLVWGELSYEETAVAMSVPVGTVRSRVNRSRRTLQRAIGREPIGATPSSERRT